MGGEDDYAKTGGDNDTVWLDPPEAPNRRVRNFSIGLDRGRGELSLRPRPEKPPSGTPKR